jgi:hypothetical protein
VFLFVKAKYLYYSFFDLGDKIFFLYLDRLLVRYRKYLVSLVVIIGFVLVSAFSITSIFRIRNNHITARLIIKINKLLTTGI